MKNSIVFKLSRVLLLVVGLGLMSASSLFAQSTNTYEYDNLNRLIKTTYGNGAVVQYTYDEVGNRIQKQVSGVCVQYTITATASPTAGGMVSGAGSFDEGSSCTLTATPNTGYSFIRWTKNGSQVSTSASYTFTVTENASYVAVFSMNSYNITASASPSNGGSVSGSGTYNYGANCTLTATANSGYNFINWKENGVQVSSSANYTFTVTENRTLVATFEAVQPNTYVITASANPNNGGVVTGSGTYSEGATCMLTASPNTGYTFTNWTKNSTVVSTNASYSFTVTGTATYVANFAEVSVGITQTTVLPQGWTWWSTYVEQTGNNGLTQMEESLGSYGMQIKSQANGFVTNASGMWYGSLSGIANESTYMVQTSGACQMTVTGSAATPTAHPITLPTGWTWIGYPCSSPMSVSTAMSGLTPAANDQLKAQESFAVYTAGVGWLGSLQTVTPGMGLMFQSHSGTAVTLTYPNPTKTEELKENATTRGNHWTPEVTQYPDNMTMVAVVELDGEELRGEQYELAAFAEGECRGSAELMYVAVLDRYMAFMTLYGDGPAEVSFGLYDAMTGEENYETNEIVPYSANATMGTPTEPCVIRFRGLTGVGELNAEVKVFPNPVRRGQTLSIGTADGEAEVEIDIVNALGVVVGSNTSVKSPATIKAPSIPGVYTLRITIEGKGTHCRRLIVR